MLLEAMHTDVESGGNGTVFDFGRQWESKV